MILLPLLSLTFSQPSSSCPHTSHLLPSTPTQRRFLTCIQSCGEEPTQQPHPWVHYPLLPRFCHIRSTGLCSSQFAASYLYTIYFFTSPDQVHRDLDLSSTVAATPSLPLPN
ncbi:uncharacterized protein BDV14DRAFT_178584 [Aspergillus stella-maris]|uniref:uncharacterized protein n=1 Tax=Aspergillus stella-maris TaxID=1810926 RepID=UPI003CCD1ECA